MSEELFEIAFCGEIAEGAELETVKLRVGQMFKADAERVQKLFSGQRVVIKKQADAGMVAKYRAAFERAGAVCEVMTQAEAEAARAAAEVAANATADIPVVKQSPPTGDSGGEEAAADQADLPPALQSRLRVRADQIPPLEADLAPVGSPVQHRIVEPPPFDIDIEGLVLAPVGAPLITSPEPPTPPWPDTSGLELLDNE